MNGLVLRPYSGESDNAAILEISNLEYEFDHVPERLTLGDLNARYGNPSAMFDALRDVTLAEIDGQAVGWAERSWVDTADGQLREYRCDGAVLPDWRRRGIGTALLAENQRRSRALAAGQPTDRPLAFGSWTMDQQAAANALLREDGYQPARWFFDMSRPLAEPIPDLPLPDGIVALPALADQVQQVWLADVEAFQDHWGGFDSSDQALQRWRESPNFDPSMWVVAWDGSEVAGAVVNAIHVEENAALGVRHGWLHSVFTRRAWRRRGLAHALIARSLTELKVRGMEQGMLGVDADNPNGALGLYEGIGFVVAERSTAWRKSFEV